MSLLDDTRTALVPGAFVLHGYALAYEDAVLAAVRRVMDEAPPRRMMTPGGYSMSVETTTCGDVGWITDRSGYRYSSVDPLSGQPWPRMPGALRDLATGAAAAAGFAGFVPDSCLVNRYAVGTKMGLHQDKDEADFSAPIVSVSLGLPATFLFGGAKRSDPTTKVPLQHGDIVVWGGPSRLNYHGVLTVKAGHHPLLGETRINLTFRRAR